MQVLVKLETEPWLNFARTVAAAMVAIFMNLRFKMYLTDVIY